MGFHRMCETWRCTGWPSKSQSDTPSGVRIAISPSARKNMSWVWERIAGTSLATKYSLSPMPAVQPDRLPHDCGIAAQARAPEVGMEHGDFIGVRQIPAASLGYGNTERGEIVPGRLHRKDPARFHAVIEIDESLRVFAGNVLEHTAAAKSIDDGWLDMAVASLPDVDQRLGVADGRLTEQELDGQRKHGGIDADAETERQQCRHHESRAPAKRAGCVNQVPPEVLDRVEAPQIERLFLDEAGVPEGNGIAGGRRHFAMEREFGFEILLHAPAPKQLEKQPADHRGCLASTRSTAVERRSQVSCCWAISFLPRFVIS